MSISRQPSPISRTVSPLSQNLHPNPAPAGPFQPPDDVSDAEPLPSRHPFRDTQSTQLQASPEGPQPSPEDSQNVPSHEEKPLVSRRVTLFRRLGWYSVTVLLSGLLLLIATIGVLAFLWFSGEENNVWRALVLDDRISTAVTLAALVIQLTVTAQASGAIAMLASLVLERWGVPIGQSLFISTMRFTNTGPLASLITFSKNFRTLGGVVTFLLALGLAITTIVSQFSSTILLLDFTLQSVTGRSEAGEVATSFEDPYSAQYYENNYNYWIRTPPAYQTFAEHWTYVDSPDDQVDTGHIIRALLPYSSEATRLSLQSYEGTATVWDARVACVRPVFTNTTYYYNSDGNWRFAGSAAANSVVSGVANGDKAQLSFTFDCEGQNHGSYSQIICPFNSTSTSLNSSVDANPGTPTDGFSWLVLNYLNASTLKYTMLDKNSSSNYGWDSAVSAYMPPYNGSSTERWDSFEHGPWIDLLPKYYTVDQPVINASLCYDALSMSADVHIIANSTANRTEPIIAFDQAKDKYIIDDVVHQVGATVNISSASDRGILTLDPTQLQTGLRTWQTAHKGETGGPGQIQFEDLPSYIQNAIGTPVRDALHSSYILCVVCHLSAEYDSETDVVHLDRRQAAVFQGILEATHDPSLALQAHFTTLVRMIYYDMLAEFNARNATTTTTFRVHSYPQYVRGFIVVCANIGVHICLVVTVMLLFCLHTRYSLLDNAWPALAQVATSATERLLERSGLAKDDDVDKLLEGENMGRLHVRLQRIGVNGEKVGIV